MSIKEIFDSMDYGTAPESAAEAQKWLEDKGRAFGHFINGKFTKPGDGFDTRNPANDEHLAQITQATQTDVDAAVSAAKSAQKSWAKLGGHKRARKLYALARLLQKHSRLLAVLETMDNGKPIRESRDIDIPLAQRHFYYHAGLAQLLETELPDRDPIGVCGQIIPWNFPLLMLAWKIAPALAAGNTVVLKPAEYTPLTALAFAELCQMAGLPKGVVNIVTGDEAVGEMIVTHPDVQKIAFTGSTEVGRIIRRQTAGTGKSLTLELGGKSPFIIFDDADLDSAVEGVVDAIWFNQGQVCCAGSRLLVHEAVSDKVHAKLVQRMEKLRVGDPMDKSIDIGAIVHRTQHDRISDMIGSCQAGTVHQPDLDMPDSGWFYPPTLISGLSPAHPLMQEEIFGPVLVTTTFRTPAEAIQLANNTKYGLAASVWSENVNLCLGIAPQLKAGVVWVNGTNMFDAAASFGGMRESGFGREGGWEGLQAYTKPKTVSKKAKLITPKSGAANEHHDLDRTAKLYIGGKQARPDSGYSKAVYDASGRYMSDIPLASRKDIRNAVEAAVAAESWGKTTGHLRSQILYYLGENLDARKTEFAARLDQMRGSKTGAAEVEASIEALFTYGAWADKFDGDVRNVPIRGVALGMNEPVGIIGAFCPDSAPLLGLITALGSALAMGNRVVLTASEAYPLSATDLYQILDTSDVPKGVVSILTGSHVDLAPHMASHLGVDAVWSFSAQDISKTIEENAAGNIKLTWVNYGLDRDWLNSDPIEFLHNATERKTIWIPFGEG